MKGSFAGWGGGARRGGGMGGMVGLVGAFFLFFQNTVQILNNRGLEEAHLHMKKGQFTCGERWMPPVCG